MKRWIVLDTNVLVSGVFSGGSGSPPERIVEGMLAGTVRFLVSEELVFEYRRILLDPRARKRHGLDEDAVDGFLEALLENSAIRKPAGGETSAPAESADDPPAPPPGDEHVMALLGTEPLVLLVTGDRALAEALRGWRDVLSPADFVSALGQADEVESRWLGPV